MKNKKKKVKNPSKIKTIQTVLYNFLYETILTELRWFTEAEPSHVNIAINGRR